MVTPDCPKATDDAYAGLLLHQLFEQAVEKFNSRVALECEGVQVTYAQLNHRADKLCQAILHQAPTAALVGLSTTRGPEMIVGVLAVLKAGKAYLPLDPSYPEQRLRQLVADSNLEFCVAPGPDEATFTALGLSNIRPDRPHDHPARVVAQPNSTALVLYTSGSTGKPKGVCLSHRGLVNFLTWQTARWANQPGLQALQFSHLSFDASFQEIFVPLLTGSTLHLIDDSYRLNAGRLLEYIQAKGINRIFLPYVALQYLAEAAVADNLFPESLLEVITGGEQIKITPQLTRFFGALPGCAFMNAYGPTEASVWITEQRLQGDAPGWPPLPDIGRPIGGVSVFLLNENLALVAEGEVGELCVSGACLAEGYLNEPDLTAEKFIAWTHPEHGPLRLYRTGDLARRQPGGSLSFQGRRDDQVKIRGNRVELGEIEVLLNGQPAVQQAVVVAREEIPGQKRLVAYIVAPAAGFNALALRHALEQRLPDFMIPSYFVRLDDLPRTTSGKVDKRQLPPPAYTRPELNTPYQKPQIGLEKHITELWGEWLQLRDIGRHDNFFELGGSSLLAQKTVAALKQQQYALPITKLYQYPTAAGLARFLEPQPGSPPAPAPPALPAAAGTDIAVIGLAGRFPGADTMAELWQVLKQGQETTCFFTDEELDATLPAALTTDPLYVKARGVISHAKEFDAAFFGLTPKLAELMDPQQRVFLEIAWEALEQAGYLPSGYDGRVGVFAGSGTNTYYQHNVLPNQHLVSQVGAVQVTTLNEKDFIASRTAYHLDLRGPAVSVYSACSTSLLAVAQAVQSLRDGQCEVALAGGASVTSPIHSGHLYQEGAMLSRDGHCRTFDAQAQGTVFSDGAGVVLLKPLAAARHDGDTVYAVIKGVGVNNDGSGKGSFTAPSAEGQAGAITMALRDARVEPATISYVEAHGTATPLGDPIEVEGLTMAFGEQSARQFCALSSIKSNMGHLTAAAGVAGLIKATLALHHRQLPASVGFAQPNPAIDFANSPFFVNTKHTDWQPAGVRRAGVSSFGVGGTNVHVVLEEFGGEAPPSTPGRPVQLVAWSAKTTSSRETYAGRLADYLRQEPPLHLADVASTLHQTRVSFRHRRFVVAATTAELAQALSAEPTAATPTQTASQAPGQVVFLFPGQGSQYLNMGRELYEQESVFRQAVDECAGYLLAELGTDIRTIIYPDTPTSAAEAQLKNTRYTQPALFVTEYALARLWLSWGIQPTIFCGHSIGEFVAAHLAGVFSLPDALRLVAVRGRLVSELPGGSMLSVRLAADKVQDLLPTALSVAAINSAQLCVVAGPDHSITEFARQLDEQRVPNRRLATSHAFHSAMMDPIVADFRAIVEQVSLSKPRQPIVSTVTGTWLTDAQATDAQYWASHLRLPVRFAEALTTIFGQEDPLLLEVGPGNVVATLARQQAPRPYPILPGLHPAQGARTELREILTVLGQLWLNGLAPDWQAFYAGQQRRKLSLPTYAFDRKPCWVEPPAAPPPAASVPVAEAALSMPLPVHIMRKSTLLAKVKSILEDASGIDMAAATPTMSLLEIGLDSLLITQVAITLKKEFNLPLTFRQLNEEYATLEALVAYLDSKLPAEAYQPVAAAPVSAAKGPAPVLVSTPATAPAFFLPGPTAPAPHGDMMLGLVAQQLQLLSQQVMLLQSGAGAPVTPAAPAPPAPALPVAAATPVPAAAPAPDLTPEEVIELKKPFGASARIERQSTALSELQQEFLQQLTSRYTQKTRASKAYTQQHRAHMADPRVVSGFKPLTKELVYPLVVNRSKGSHLWDLDGNDYIDALNGFGSSMLGYQPEVVAAALHAQIDNGYEVGPQHELAGEVSALICEFTGFERAALCSTGSEAVLGTMRVARTVTGRTLIVAFAGSYHGIVDEALVRGTRKLKTYPAAAGIMPEAVQNMLILDYGTDESLRIIRERAHELAAVLVEPVQSRRPEFAPVEFLRQVRDITAASGTALIFDEVITGFRMHPGGAQALFGIRADLASYGKVVGGGVPIGVIAGKKEFMDALDGGFWQYGDASYPEVGVTYFAGTFVRHPLALAAAKASLLYLKAKGPALQKSISNKADYLANALNTEFDRLQLPMFVASFGSLWKIKFKEEIPYSELLFALMRQKGIHIWDGFPCFMTEAHTTDEVSLMVSVCLESTQEMIKAGFFTSPLPKETDGNPTAIEATAPPVPGAKLGRDAAGNPAWFIINPELPGRYLKIDASLS